MGAIASFKTYLFDSSEVVSMSGSIEYPYIRVARLRSFTTLQIGAKTTETIEIQAILDPQNFEVIKGLAVGRVRDRLVLGSKDWGEFRIDSLSRSVRQDGKIQATMTFRQTGAGIPNASFASISSAIGSFGILDIGKEELLVPIRENFDSPTAILPRLQSLPKVQDVGEGLKTADIALKFDNLYSSSVQGRLDAIRALGDTYSYYPLVLEGIDYGSYALQRIAWEIVKTNNIGDAIAATCNLSLLQNFPSFPPRLPKIFSLQINNIERLGQLAPNLSSLTYQDPIDGGTSLLELEFDAQATGLPGEGDLVRVIFGYDQEASLPNTKVLDTGIHRCDRPTRRYNPDTVTIGSQSYDYGQTTTVNTKQRMIFAQQSLSAIVSAIATNCGLTLIGDPSGIIAGNTSDATTNVTVSGNSYLEILQSLAADYGYAFRLKYGTLLFRSYSSLETQGYSFALTPSDCLSAEFTNKNKGIYKTATFPYKGNNTAASLVDSTVPTNDTLDFRPSPLYNDANAATQRSQGELYKNNRSRHEGTITIEGRFDAIAGINIQLATFRDPDNGVFQVNSCTHKLSANNGWQTELKVRKIFYSS